MTKPTVLSRRQKLVYVFSTMFIGAAIVATTVFSVGSAHATDPGALGQVVQSRIASGVGESLATPANVLSVANGVPHTLAASLSSSGSLRCISLDDSNATCFDATTAGGMTSMLAGGGAVVSGYTPGDSSTVVVRWQGVTYTSAVRNHYYVVDISAPSVTDASGMPVPVRPTISFR